MKDFITYCKQYIYDNLPEHEGRLVYLCDLGYTITEGPNCDGTLTFNREEALEYLKEWWREAADYFQFEKDNFGTPRNPFENPEAYMVCMVIEGVRALIDDAIDTLGMNDKWNDEVELTPELIAKVKECVEGMYVEKLF